MADAVELRGLKEVDERLAALGQVAGQRAMRQSLFQASKPIVDRAKANVRAWPGGSGALHLSLGRSFRAKNIDRGVEFGASSGTRFSMQIGPRLKVAAAIALHNLFYRRQRRGIFYGHLLEFGHRIANRKTGRLSRAAGNKDGAGQVQPQRFLQPALEATSLRAVFILQNQLKKRIERALRRQKVDAENA